MGRVAHIYRLVALAIISLQVALAAPVNSAGDENDKRMFKLGRRSAVSGHSDVDQWEDKREPEAYAYGDQGENDLDVDDKRAYGRLLAQEEGDDDGSPAVSPKRLFKLGKRPSFKLGKRLFKFGKRPSFKFGKRPMFKFGKRPMFKFGKRPSFKLGKRRSFMLGKRDALENNDDPQEEVDESLFDGLSEDEKMQLYSDIVDMMGDNTEASSPEKRRQILLGKKPFGTGNFHWSDNN